jgi:hypothetical protein
MVVSAGGSTPVVREPCTKIPQPDPVYTHPIPPTNPAPVDPIVAVPSPGGGSFAELVTKDGVVTRQKFEPRGADYVRLATIGKGRNTTCVISTFDVGSGLDAYNPHRAAQALAGMEKYGYNVVHVSLNPVESGETSGSLNPAYWANVTNFINLARSYNIRVSIDLMPLPDQDIPGPSTIALPAQDQRSNGNLYYLEPAYLTAEESYVTDLIGVLKADDANLSDMFSFELRGETYFKTNLWPLDLKSGIVSTITGTFNMASATSRDAMIESNTLYWENHLTELIHSAVPGSLVAVGFTQGLTTFPQNRIGRPQSSLSPSSQVDYVDLHMYPKFGPIYAQINSIGIAPDTVTKPIIMGEFGEYMSQAHTPAAAAAELAAWQERSCDIDGFRFSGWLVWTWDTTPSEQSGLFNMVDGDDAIASALAPRIRSNPCTPDMTSLSASVDPHKATAGDSVTYSATVSGSGGTPTGTISFTTGPTHLCTAALSGGSGSCEASIAPVGSDPVRATYSGDAIHGQSARAANLLVRSPPVTNGNLPGPLVGMASLPDGFGYWLVDSKGGVSAHGDAINYGSMAGRELNAPIAHIVPTPDGEGYWLVARDGGTFAFGDAGFYGSMGGEHLNAPVVNIAPTSDGHGYWLVASDGGVFAFGDARFHGSMGGRTLNRPIVGIATDNQTGGYWEVAADGGIFAFDAPFLGSTGAITLNKPVIGMTPTANDRGYLFVASDGGIFTYGNAEFYGSMGGRSLNGPVVGMATDNATFGYWLVGADGGIFSFGAPFYGAD